MLYFAEGAPDAVIDRQRSSQLIDGMLASLGSLRRVLLLPPDFTRRHSGAGELTVLLYERLAHAAHVEVMPTLGTHAAMTRLELETMFPGIPAAAFRVHHWRTALARLGEVPAAQIRDITGDRLDFPLACEINRLLVEQPWDRIISIGQLVPHEVAGIANHSKNVFVGAGGADTINKTHYLGAVCGLEAALGRTRTPVRAVFQYMAEHFTRHLPITYLLTVRASDAGGSLLTRGLYAGDGEVCFQRGAALCQQVNLSLLDEPLANVVVYLDPAEFRSTWLGNKAMYRTRMALATGGRLTILAPGVGTFGEDPEIDRLIRAYGYRGTPHTLRMVREHPDLAANLAAAAHLIHGSSEDRFGVTYCPGKLTREEVESVGFEFGELAPMLKRYDPAGLRDGWNDVAGERVFFISNPGLGLWALRSQFAGEPNGSAEADHAE
jgi:nickel-dependent lactate racemase